MKCRFVFLSAVLVVALGDAFSSTSAQEVSAAALPGTADVYGEILAFSKDGRRLREIQRASPSNFWSVRAVTYDSTTGSISHLLNLEPDTCFYSATSDGRTAIISVNRDREDARPFLVDMETGQTQDIPLSWFDADDHNLYAAISGDGRLVSVYSQFGPADGPLVVTLYDWRKKKLVVKRSTGTPAGGISSGGVTEDGKIEFLNNRVGGEVVDPKTGRLLVRVGPNSNRSPDGAWDVEFPHPLLEDAPQDVTIANRGGEVVGKLDLQITDDKENWAWGRGAFCGTLGKFIASTKDSVQAFEIPSGKRIASFAIETWRAKNPTDATVTPVACSATGKRVAIRSGERLTLHDLK
jgi:hypothetical protein